MPGRQTAGHYAKGAPGSTDFDANVTALAIAATVQVVDRAQGTSGSGVVVGQETPFVYVLTASHVVSAAKAIELRAIERHFSGNKVLTFPSPELIGRDAEADLAVLRVSTWNWKPAVLRVSPPTHFPQARFRALTTGYDDDRIPKCMPATVECRCQVRKSPDAPAGWMWQLDVAQDEGRSGGGLVDQNGYLIGIASGVNDHKGYYSDIESIYRFLGRNGLQCCFKSN